MDSRANLDHVSPETRKFLISNIVINHPPQRFSKAFDSIAKWAPFRVILFLKKMTSADSYMSVIESKQFLIRANTAFSADRKRRTKKFLKVALELLGRDLPSGFKRSVLKKFFSVIRDPNLHKETSIALIEATEVMASETQLVSPDTWFFLSKFLNWFGFLKAGCIARENSALLWRAVKLDDLSSVRSVETSCAAHLESGDLLSAENLLLEFKHKISAHRLPHFQFYIDSLHGSYVFSDSRTNGQFVESEQKLIELVRGRQVVLVGTGSPMGNYGNEIDEADTVVRVKFSGTDHLPSGKFHGTRCDIALYPNLLPMKMILRDGVDLEFLRDLKLVLTFTKFDSPTIQKVPVMFVDGLRSAYPYGDLTSGIMCLVNLLRYQPSSLKLFGFDFYAGQVLYDSNLINFYKDQGWTMGDPTWRTGDRSSTFFDQVQGHFWHDQISNFSLARNLYKAGKFTVEPFGASILELTPIEYADRIEQILGKLLVANKT